MVSFAVAYCVLFSLILTKQGIKCFGTQQAQNQILSCEENTSQLGNLLTLACINAGGSEVRSCINGFSSAVRANNNQPSISALTTAAETYLSDTRYDECVSIIEHAVPATSGQCSAGYCAFVRCIRRLNGDFLISDCFSQASEDNDAVLETDQIILYKNITSCILATARCSTINPITGQRQTNAFTSTSYSFGRQVTSTVPLYNALQINPAGDVRIIALPGTTSIQKYLCPYEVNLRETSWLTYNC